MKEVETVLRIQLLDSFQIHYKDKPIDSIKSARLQSLLAYLVLNRNAPQPRQQIAYQLWPVSDESQARTNLRKLFLQLRRSLPDADDFLIFDNHTIQWRADSRFTLDVDEVEQLLKEIDANPLDRDVLTRIFDVYTGNLLPNCYDDWIVPLRKQLHQDVMTALDRLATLSENRRAYEEGIQYAQGLLIFDPLEEKNYQRLMRLHALNGNRAGALRIYQDCMAALQSELGVEPSEETQAIYERILAQDAKPEIQLEQRSPHANQIPLVGRQQEWQTLQETWQKASRGAPHLICIQGEAGIGKTRLAEELLEWVTLQGALTARTRAYRVQGAMAYAPITELLRSKTLNSYLKRVEPIWLAEIMRLLPELAETFPDLPQPQPMTESWQRQRLFEALTRAVLSDGHPVLLLLDDLQWCERETLEWFDFLLRFNPQARLLIVGTIRTGETLAQQALDELYRSLQRDDLVTLLSLKPLTTEETSELAQLVTGAESSFADSKQLFDETAGNPLFVVETVRANLTASVSHAVNAEQAGLPPKIYSVIQSRLLHLSPETQTVINIASVIGRSFTYDLLVEAARLDEDELIDCLDELWHRQIIREQGANTYDFTHDRIRDIAYAEISHPRKRQLHRRIATALETIHSQNLDRIAGELAFHYEQVGSIENAVLYYQRAANFAKLICAYEKAGTYANQGLALLKTGKVTASMARAELDLQLSVGTSLSALYGYGYSLVENAFQQAHQLSESLGDSSELYPILHGLTMFYMSRSDLNLAQQLASRCLKLATQTQNRDFLVEAYTLSGLVCFYRGEFSIAKNHFEDCLGLYELEMHRSHYLVYTQDPGVVSLGFLGVALWALGYPVQAKEKLRAALALAQKISHPYSSLIAQFCLTWLYDFYQDALATAQEAQTLIELSDKYEFRLWWLVGQIYNCRAQAELNPSVQQAIVENGHQIIEAYKETGMKLALPFFLGVLAKIYLNTKQYEKGLALLKEALALCQNSNEGQYEVECHRFQGDLLLSSDPEQAESAYLRAIQVSQQQQARSLELRATTSLARVYAHRGQVEKAYHLLSNIYGWFTEGFETKDLTEAKALLDELSASSATSN